MLELLAAWSNNPKWRSLVGIMRRISTLKELSKALDGDIRKSASSWLLLASWACLTGSFHDLRLLRVWLALTPRRTTPRCVGSAAQPRRVRSARRLERLCEAKNRSNSGSRHLHATAACLRAATITKPKKQSCNFSANRKGTRLR